MRASIRLLAPIAALSGSLCLMSCATLQKREPLQVTVSGFEPLQEQAPAQETAPGMKLETRMIVNLRVQNPNDSPVDYNGVSVQMLVQGKSFATGVSDASGSVPRFGETVVTVPVTISAFNMIRQALGIMGGGGSARKLSYELKGKLNGKSGATSFKTAGEFDMPALGGTLSP